MPRPPKTIQYTLKDRPGLLITVESKNDDESARQKALDEVMKQVESGEIDLSDFPNGLGINDFIFVDTPTKAKSIQNDRELQPIERAAKEVAQFALLKVALQKNQESAQQYLDLINALFSPAPLTTEQIEIAQDKSFAKTLESLATSKLEFDSFAETAKAAWQLLKPALVTGASDAENSQVSPSTNKSQLENKPDVANNRSSTPKK